MYENTERTSGHKPDILKNIEKEVSLTPEEALKKIVNKQTNGSCSLIYENDIREGYILSLSSNGAMVIGLVKKDLKDN